MNPLETLFHYRDTTINLMDELLGDYSTLSLNELMKRSETVLMNLKALFVLQELMINETDNPDLKKRFEQDPNGINEAMDLYERVSMLHVDEPDGSFRTGLEKFDHLLTMMTQPSYETLMQDIQSQLNEGNCANIGKQLLNNKIQPSPDIATIV